MQDIIDRYETSFKNLLTQYNVAYQEIRLEHDIFRHKQSKGTLDNSSMSKLQRVNEIEGKLNNIFIDMLNETGITDSSKNTSLSKSVEESKKKLTDIYDNSATISYQQGVYIENAAIEREKILRYHILREKLFFGLLLLCLGVSVYVFFRDLEANNQQSIVKPRPKPKPRRESKPISVPKPASVLDRKINEKPSQQSNVALQSPQQDNISNQRERINVSGNNNNDDPAINYSSDDSDI